MAREVLTVCDAMDAMIDMLGVATTSAPLRAIRRVVQQAVREVVAAAKTPYMQKHGRIQLRAPYETGTVVYDHTGGTYERMLTLTTGVWPSTWVEDGSVLIDSLVCDVEAYKSTTVITLDVNLNPGADVASTTYSLFPRYYRLPDDFDASSNMVGEDVGHLGREIPMDEMMALMRHYTDSGTVTCYSIGGIQDLVGHLGLFVYPKADAADTIDFTYYRKPREIRYTGKDTNDSVGTLASSTTTAIVGNSTVFNTKMLGSILRMGDATYVPTGLSGEHPYADERMIHGFTDTTHITIDRAPSVATALAKYCVTDYIDIDPTFYDAFLARCRYDLAVLRNLPNQSQYLSQYQEQLHLAKCASCRGTQPQVAGEDRLHLPQIITVGGYYDETY